MEAALQNIAWRKVTDVSFEELPQLIGPNQIWKATVTDIDNQSPYFVTGPDAIFEETGVNKKGERFIIVSNCMWARTVEERAWGSSANIYESRAPYMLVGENKVEASGQSIKDFLEELNPSDIGSDIIGKYIVAYEGFTYECWEDAEENDKSVDDLEKEILKEWQRKYKSKPIRYGWLRGGEFGEDDIFYAIFPNKKKLSWKIVDITVGDNVRITENEELLEAINIFPADAVAGLLGEVIEVDATYNFRRNIADASSYDGVVDVSVDNRVWAFPYSHWKEFLTIEYGTKLSWKEHLNPKDIWDGSKQMRDMFWEHIPDKIRFYGDGELSYDELPEDIKKGFNNAVNNWEKFWEKHWEKHIKRSWQQRLDPEAVWDGITPVPDSFWDDLLTKYMGLKIYRDAQKKYEKLPNGLKSFFNKMVSRWERQHSKETLAWQVHPTSFTAEQLIANLKPHQVWRDLSAPTRKTSEPFVSPLEQYYDYFVIGDKARYKKRKDPIDGEVEYEVYEAVWSLVPDKECPPGHSAFIYESSGPFELVDLSKESWQIIFEPQREVATVMYTLSGVDYPLAAMALPALADITVEKIAEALTQSGHADTAADFNKFVNDCISIIDGAMVYNNTDVINSAVVETYIKDLPDLADTEARWHKIAAILKDVSENVINKKTSSMGAHVAWRIQYNIDEDLRRAIRTIFNDMRIEPEINIAPFTYSFSRDRIAKLTILLEDSGNDDLFLQVMWLREKSDMFLDRAIKEMTSRGVTSIEFEDVLNANEKDLLEEYGQRYITLYNIFQRIIGGENG